MYLVICKNKHGLSIDDANHSKDAMNATAEFNNKASKLNGNLVSAYHVRKFDISQIDLDKLMREE